MKRLTESEKKARREQMSKCAKVCERAERELTLGPNYQRISLLMDLESLPDLNLDKLLSFPTFDFAHDIHGIRAHMDRSNWPGKLTGCFEPRCGKVKGGAA